MSKTNECEARYNAGLVKIRQAATVALKEIDRLHSGGTMAREAFDAEVARITQEKLQPYGCALVVHSMGDSVTRLLIKVQSTGRTYDLIKSFFHRDNGR